jgi:branched-subunit amino acid transport protein
MNQNDFLILLALLFLTSAPLRLLPLLFKKDFLERPFIKKVIQYIPVSIFSALLCSEIFFKGHEQSFSLDHNFVHASIPTFAVAFFTKSLSLSIIIGILSVAVLNHFS